MKKVIRIVSLVIIAAAVLFFAYKLIVPQAKKSEADVITAEKKNDQAESSQKLSSLPVKVTRAARGSLPMRLRISATADVWEKTIIKAEVAGTVNKISRSIGDRVVRASDLVSIDDREIQLEVDQAQTAKLKALSEFLVNEDIQIDLDTDVTPEDQKKLQELKARYLAAAKDFEQGRLSEKKFQKISEEYDTQMVFSGALREDIRKAKDGLSDAMIALKRARLQLKRTRIRSPFPGIVADISVSPGEKVSIGQELIKVVNLDSLYLKGFALESEISQLKKGTRVRIKLDSFPDRFFAGEIEAISPEVDAEKKTITVFVRVDNREHLILPGMHAEVDIEYKVYHQVIKVPRIAVITRQRPLVFVVEGKQAIWKYVELGAHNDEEVEIRSGLNEGELVVIEGQMTLAHQSKVKIVK